MNLNKIARKITLEEGGEINLSIAQVKEVIRLYNEELSEQKPSDVLKMLERV